MDNIVSQSSSMIDRPHTAISTWVARDPNGHPFQSIIGLSYPNKIAPNGAAVIFAAPIGPTACEGGSVQIYPTAQPCSIVQAGLLKNGHTLASIQALPVVETGDGARSVLMPTAGSGCVIVTVRPR